LRDDVTPPNLGFNHLRRMENSGSKLVNENLDISSLKTPQIGSTSFETIKELLWGTKLKELQTLKASELLTEDGVFCLLRYLFLILCKQDTNDVEMRKRLAQLSVENLFPKNSNESLDPDKVLRILQLYEYHASNDCDGILKNLIAGVDPVSSDIKQWNGILTLATLITEYGTAQQKTLVQLQIKTALKDFEEKITNDKAKEEVENSESCVKADLLKLSEGILRSEANKELIKNELRTGESKIADLTNLLQKYRNVTQTKREVEDPEELAKMTQELAELTNGRSKAAIRLEDCTNQVFQIIEEHPDLLPKLTTQKYLTDDLWEELESIVKSRNQELVSDSVDLEVSIEGARLAERSALEKKKQWLIELEQKQEALDEISDKIERTITEVHEVKQYYEKEQYADEKLSQNILKDQELLTTLNDEIQKESLENEKLERHIRELESQIKRHNDQIRKSPKRGVIISNEYNKINTLISELDKLCKR